MDSHRLPRRRVLLGAAGAPLLACGPPPTCDAGADVASWVRYAGRILVMGDSITVGHVGLIGGWRVGLSAALTAAGVGHVYVGPHSDAYGAHRGVSGTSAFQQTSAVQTDCETYDPRVIVIGYGANDVGGASDGGQERTAAQTLVELSEVVAWARAGAPQAVIAAQTVIVPQNGTIVSYYARRAIFTEINGLLPAWSASEGVRLIDVGAPSTTDGLHPDADGYASMAAAISNAVLALVPGV